MKVGVGRGGGESDSKRPAPRLPPGDRRLRHRHYGKVFLFL
jgi:hypothetical protein